MLFSTTTCLIWLFLLLVKYIPSEMLLFLTVNPYTPPSLLVKFIHPSICKFSSVMFLGMTLVESPPLTVTLPFTVQFANVTF